MLEGFIFPLNPVWPIRDSGWMELLKAFSDNTSARNAMAAWFPPSMGIVEKIVSVSEIAASAKQASDHTVAQNAQVSAALLRTAFLGSCTVVVIEFSKDGSWLLHA